MARAQRGQGPALHGPSKLVASLPPSQRQQACLKDSRQHSAFARAELLGLEPHLHYRRAAVAAQRKLWDAPRSVLSSPLLPRLLASSLLRWAERLPVGEKMAPIASDGR